MEEGERGRFLDLLYDAAFEPSLWIPAMERLADLIGGECAMLSRLNMADGSGSVEIARIDPDAPRRYFDYYALKNPLSNVTDPAAYLRDWRPLVLTDEDWMAKAELVRTEYYNDFMAPQDMHSVAMIRLAAIDLDVFAISVTRSERRGGFERAGLDLAAELHPHLIRAFSLGRKVAGVRGARDDLAEVLDRSAHGVLLLSPDGRVRHANRAAERMIAKGVGLTIVDGRLGGAALDDDRRLEALIAAAAGRQGERRGGAMALARAGHRRPLSVAVAPARPERFAIFHDGPAVMVCVTDLEADGGLSETRLRDLFALSGAEARAALALFRGLGPKEAATTLGLSLFTVRGHLARIYEKTHTGGQVELTRLMMRAAELGE
ncbi:MAG: helix-turn-helix transcriptional regulator [Caulobacteraceae bacterium]